MSYTVESRPASKNGYYTPQESNATYKTRYARGGCTIHWWNTPDKAGTHDQTVEYILGTARAGTMSANYVVSNGRITQLVDADMVTFGSLSGNPTTINIECDPRLNDEGYRTVGWLIAELEKRYGRTLTLYPHKHWTATACPGTLDLARMRGAADTFKQGDEAVRNMTRDEVYWEFVTTCGIAPSEQEVRRYEGKPYDFVNEDIKRYVVENHVDFGTFRKNMRVQVEALGREIADLKERPTTQSLNDLQARYDALQTACAKAPERPSAEPEDIGLLAKLLSFLVPKAK